MSNWFSVNEGLNQMKFSDFVVREAIVTDLDPDASKEEIIRRLCEALCEAGALSREHLDDIVRALIKREELGTTGIGMGVAVPHTKHPSVDKLVATVGISPEGVDFDALDGEKVHALFLLVSPTDLPGDHLRALEYITRQLHNPTFARFLKQAKTPDDVWVLLEEADAGKYASH